MLFRSLGYVDSVGVLRGLAAQAGTSYLSAVDPRCVRLAPAGLCADEVRAMGIVPIRTVEADRIAIVACVAPVPNAALRAMQRVTGYTAVPYLVSEHDFATLAAAYGADVPAGGDAPPPPAAGACARRRGSRRAPPPRTGARRGSPPGRPRCIPAARRPRSRRPSRIRSRRPDRKSTRLNSSH